MKHIELEVPIEEMDEADLRATFAEVMEAHEQNVEKYAELESELEEAQEFSHEAESLREELNEAKAYFAEKGEAVTGIDSNVLVERFEMEELAQFAEKYDAEQAEFAEEADEDEEAEFSEDDDADEDAANIFADRPSKAPDFSDALDARKEAAKERLKGLGGIAVE